MTRTQLIADFELFMDDTSELSSTETAHLFDKIYQRISSQRPWEMLKTEATGTLSTSVPYVTLPTDFAYMVPNNNYTDQGEYATGPVVFVGTNRTPFTVVSWSDRGRYVGRTDVCYVDIKNSRLVFVVQPTSADTYTFDYIAVPATLGADDEPWMPERFQYAIYHGMCSDSFVIQQSDKAKSYRTENEKKYKEIFDDMCYWNAQLVQ